MSDIKHQALTKGASSPERIAIIGMGAMGRRVVRSLQEGAREGLTLAGMDPFADPSQVSSELHIEVFSDLTQLLDWHPTVVVECAGHQAVEGVVVHCLEQGIDAIVASIGALSSDALRAELNRAKDAGKASLTVVSGAIGGLDALQAARLAGLDSVRYVGRKPPRAWSGTPAEQLFDLGDIKIPTEIFKGSASESARRYPKNANVTAAVALAGIGFDKTEVSLLADPTVNCNVHEVEAKGAFGRLSIRLENNPLPDNPKTSWLAALSIEEAILRRLQQVI